VYLVPADSTLATPSQLPSILNEVQMGTVNVRYFLTARVAAAATYDVEAYRVNDFAFRPDTLTGINMPGALILGVVWRPYTSHSLRAGISYAW
jgi:hypothetical protein